MDDDLARRLHTWVDGYVQAWNSNDPAAIGALFTQDAAYYTEPYSPPWQGRDEIVRRWLDRKDKPGETDKTLLGFELNPLHNIVHLPIGLAGLALWHRLDTARTSGRLPVRWIIGGSRQLLIHPRRGFGPPGCWLAAKGRSVDAQGRDTPAANLEHWRVLNDRA